MDRRPNPTNVYENKLFTEDGQIGLEIVWEGNGWDPTEAWIATNDTHVSLNAYE